MHSHSTSNVVLVFPPPSVPARRRIGPTSNAKGAHMKTRKHLFAVEAGITAITAVWSLVFVLNYLLEAIGPGDGAGAHAQAARPQQSLTAVAWNTSK